MRILAKSARKFAENKPKNFRRNSPEIKKKKKINCKLKTLESIRAAKVRKEAKIQHKTLVEVACSEPTQKLVDSPAALKTLTNRCAKTIAKGGAKIMPKDCQIKELKSGGDQGIRRFLMKRKRTELTGTELLEENKGLYDVNTGENQIPLKNLKIADLVHPTGMNERRQGHPTSNRGTCSKQNLSQLKNNTRGWK